MRIKTLRIKNFKGIDELELKFPAQFTVIIGDNGTGKTAILDALAVAAGSYLLGIDKVYAKPRTIFPEEARRVNISAIERTEQFPVVIEAEGIVDHQSITWKRELRGLSNKATVKDARLIHVLALEAQIKVRDKKEHRNVQLPVLAYHGTGRLWAEHKEKVEFQKQGSRLEGYIDCLSPKPSVKLFRSWFKTYEVEARNFHYPEVQTMLSTFKKAITDVVDGWEI